MNFHFTEQEIQLVVNVLATAPYRDVAPIIGKIQAQFEAAKKAESGSAEK